MKSKIILISYPLKRTIEANASFEDFSDLTANEQAKFIEEIVQSVCLDQNIGRDYINEFYFVNTIIVKGK